METLHKDVINILKEKSDVAYLNCDKCKLFLRDEDIEDAYYTLDLLYFDLAGYTSRANAKYHGLLEHIKEEALADLDKRSIFYCPEIVKWIARYGREEESYYSMVYLLSLESLRTALISFLKQTEVDTKTEQ